MKMQMVLLYTAPYKIVDEKTGQINEGISAFLYGNTDFKPKSKDNISGEKPLKQAFPTNMLAKIKEVPALYEVDVEMTAGADLKPRLTVVDLNYIGNLEIATKQAKGA